MNLFRAIILFVLCLPALAQAQTANLWIDTNGGTCTRQGTAATYSDAAACSTIQAALAAASNGDTVIMKTGNYGSQTITATKASPGVTVRCETTQATTPNSCKVGTSNGDVSTRGAWYTLQDITYSPGDSRNPVWEARCSNCTFKNWHVHGDFTGIFWLAEQPGNVTNIVWDGGELFEAGNTSGTRNCTNSDNQGMWVGAFNDSGNFFGNGTLSGTIRGVTFRGAYVAGGTLCSGDPLHLERLRIDGRVTLTVENSIFTDDGNENTGTIFVSSFLGGPPTVTFRNIYLGGQGTAGLQNNTGGVCNITFLYSTIESSAVYTPSNCEDDVVYRYNALASATCAGTHTSNQKYGTSCSGDTVRSGANFRAAMGLGSDGYTVQSGSVLINAGESTCATYATSVDIRGYARPSSTACDAGAFEFGASGGGSVPSAPSNFRTAEWLDRLWEQPSWRWVSTITHWAH